eukprot:15134.XXX_1085139_1085667_1 [CDS] Oithona nana genome sequencing.
MMAEMENLRAEKVSLEESSKLAEKKFEDELAELKAQIGTLQSQIPTEAERLILDREMRAKHEVLWRAKTENLVEDLEASKLAIHNLMQENLSLQVTIQQNQEESQRIQEEAKVKLEAKIHQL